MDAVSRTVTVTIEVERGEDTIELEVEATGYYEDAVLGGPPERCSPAEGEIEEFIVRTTDGKVWSGELTERERERAEEMIFEAFAEPQEWED